MSNSIKLISYINRHEWWRTVLPDEKAIKARGVFYASSFKDAEFYGRPLDTPFRIRVNRPLFGDEQHIMKSLGLPAPDPHMDVKKRFALDAKMKRLAKSRGYDSIALFSPSGYGAYKKTGRIPRSTELQTF